MEQLHNDIIQKYQNDIIQKYQISARNFAVTTKWGGKRYQYRVKVGQKEFDYYDAVNNYKLKVKNLDDEALLFAFYAIISDAISYIQYEDNIIDFAKEFGGIDNKSQPNFEFYLNSNYRRKLDEYLTKDEIENFRNIESTYTGCRDTYYALEKIESINTDLRNLTEKRLDEIMEELREAEIE